MTSYMHFGPSLQSRQEDLSSSFNRSASAVQTYADKFEHEYARPALRVSQAFFDEHPVTATFIAIFSFLSFVPVLSFLGFSAFILLSFTLVALSSALLTGAVIILGSLACLLFTLFIITCISGFLTTLCVAGYTLLRLATLVRSDGGDGAAEWARETKGHIAHASRRIMRGIPLRQRARQRETQQQPRQQQQQQNEQVENVTTRVGKEKAPPIEHEWEPEKQVRGYDLSNGLQRHVESEGEDGSNGSVVVVKSEDDRTLFQALSPKDEERYMESSHQGVGENGLIDGTGRQDDVKVDGRVA